MLTALKYLNRRLTIFIKASTLDVRGNSKYTPFFLYRLKIHWNEGYIPLGVEADYKAMALKAYQELFESQISFPASQPIRAWYPLAISPENIR